ncbi:MAG TPA: CRTAC1 family protein [Bryobacteraceae bacterium]
MKRIAPAAALAGLVQLLAADPSPIRFAAHDSAFRLETSETPEHHPPETMAGGVAVFDYNNDGNLDLFFVNGADIKTLNKGSSPKYSNRLYRNDGKGNFTDVTTQAGLAGYGYDIGVAIGDYDNDGFNDIFVAGVHRNTLYHNNGNGTFTDVTAKSGLASPHADPDYGPLWSVGAVWFDANNDGLLDLFIVNYVAWDIKNEPVCEAQGHREYCHPKFFKKLPNQLFLNRGNGVFEDVSAQSGIRAHPGKGMSAVVADYDNDGLMDIFVANDKVYNSLFHNLGGGKFEERAFDANVALRDNGEFISSMGADFRDLNNDGYPDIHVVALDDETFPVFLNTGKGEFTDATRGTKMGPLSLPMAGFSTNIADFDNDGWKDMFVTRGHVQSPQAAPRITVDQPNSVFRNLGGNTFAAYTAEAGLTTRPAGRHRGSAIGDLNGDGKLDVVATAIGRTAEIWMNKSLAANHWLEIMLEGTKSNRNGIGARVKLTTKSGTQYDHMSTASGYASSSAGPLHFGLGADARAESIEIRWPSGVVQVLHGVAADRILKVREQ